MRYLIAAICLLHATIVAPQFVTFKDGKIGVNFGGYHADAGLGGLLTGNAAHGGLSASAGTPWGPRAAAGLGGQVDGRTAGVAYAGAEANPSVGASAVLGGSAGEHGFAGSEAHANGKVVSNTLSSNQAAHSAAQPAHSAAPVTSAPAPLLPSYVQKVKPPKKYTLIKHTERDRSVVRAESEIIENHRATPTAAGNGTAATTNANLSAGVTNDGASVVIVHERERRQRKRAKRPRQPARLIYYVAPQQTKDAVEQQQLLQTPASSESKVVHSRKVIKSVQRPAYVGPATATSGESHTQGQANSGVVFQALSIPIGILRSLQESIGGLGGSAQYHKSVEINKHV